MPRASQRISIGNNLINHFNAVRLRVVGSGALELKLFSIDETEKQSLESVILAATTNRTATKLANFKQERTSLKVSVNVIDYHFTLTHLTIFSRPTETGYPQ